MSGPIGYAAPDGYNEIRVSPKNPLPVTPGIDPSLPNGGLTKTEALLTALVEINTRQMAVLAAILVTLGEMGGGFTDVAEAQDRLGDIPLN